MDAGIFVLAGVNGAGKSSVGGREFRQRSTGYYNPDEATSRLIQMDPGLTLEQANSIAWRKGRSLLEKAIEKRSALAFETTLGGNTITRLLEQAADSGIAVRIWFAGLESPELHLRRVRERVAKGGYDIPETAIRHRYDSSRNNLIRLLPKLDALRLFDNSEEADPAAGHQPKPRLLLAMEKGRITTLGKLAETPKWARPIIAAALAIRKDR